MTRGRIPAPGVTRGARHPAIRLAVLLLAIRVAPVESQFPPDTLRNLQMLPDSITIAEVVTVMREFSFALGVSCTHCHVGEPDAALETIDFAADDRAAKRTAREMFRMVGRINADVRAAVAGGGAPVRVGCVTCHRGLPRPILIQDELRQALDASGAEGATARYRELRQAFFGSGSYDFSEETLNEYAAGLGRAGMASDAIALLRLSEELHPASATPPFYLGEMYRLNGDTARAVASYRRSLELRPEQPYVRRLLELLGGSVAAIRERLTPR